MLNSGRLVQTFTLAAVMCGITVTVLSSLTDNATNGGIDLLARRQQLNYYAAVGAKARAVYLSRHPLTEQNGKTNTVKGSGDGSSHTYYHKTNTVQAGGHSRPHNFRDTPHGHHSERHTKSMAAKALNAAGAALFKASDATTREDVEVSIGKKEQADMHDEAPHRARPAKSLNAAGAALFKPSHPTAYD